MGTILKYLFYIILIVALYLVGRGIYEGQITEKTTVGEVMSDVGTGTKQLVKEGVANAKVGYESLKNDSQDNYENAKENAQESYNNAKENVQEGYNNAKENLKNDYQNAKNNMQN